MSENNETKINENIENKQVQDKIKNNKGKKVIVRIACVVVIAGVGFLVGANSSKIFKNQSKDTQTNSNSNNSINIEQSNSDKQDNNNSNNQDNKKQEYTQNELEQMALDYYEKKTGYRPGKVASELQQDGKLAIQLYDDMGGHNSTSDWYIIDTKTAQGTDILENQIDLKNKTFTITKDEISVKYNIQIVKKLKKENAKYFYKNFIPEISGINKTVATSIENQVKRIYDKTYKEILSNTEDDYIMEILDENSKLENYNIGFNVIAEPEYINDKIVTFEYKFRGNLGGVSWDANSGYSFNIKTGEVLKLKDIITDGTKYTKIAKNSIMNALKTDSRYDTLNNGYEEVVDSTVKFDENKEVYLREDGVVLIIPKDVIGSGADGEFEFVITYDELKDCIDLEKIL
nr:DUF3298 domain-containing protein [Clostridia bacterium]